MLYAFTFPSSLLGYQHQHFIELCPLSKLMKFKHKETKPQTTKKPSTDSCLNPSI